MKKASKKKTDAPMRREYDFSGGERGKYAGRVGDGQKLMLIEADVAAVFPDAQSVNRALRAIMEAMPPRRKRPKSA
jgi:hypothetical protein